VSSIAVVGGTGQQGRGLAQRFISAGERVIIGSRDPRRARETVATWEASASVAVADNIGAVAEADLIVIAVPFPTVDPLLTELRPHFRSGMIVIDVTVPVTFSAGKMTMLAVAEGSASEHIRARLPESVQLAAAFKTIPAHLLGAAGQPLDCDEFVCGDSDDARAGAARLIQLLPGVRAVDVGPLSRARHIEQVTALAIAINRKHKIHDARFRVVGLR
jgi:NADPH-dependent F420 reductase